MPHTLETKSILSNFGVALLAQGSAVLMSIVTTLFLPKVLGVESYGYWQLFIFYTGYAGIFHLGISEGVYLRNGGRRHSDIDYDSTGSQFRFSLIYQSFFCAVLAICGCCFVDEQSRLFVLCATSVFIVLNNASYFLGYVFQAVNETKLFSFSVMIDRLTFLPILLTALVFGIASFEFYIVLYGVSKTVSLFYCVWKGRDVVFSRWLPIKRLLQECGISITIGSKLMVANLASTLVLGSARFLIDCVWGVEEFGMLSLSLSMINFFLQFIAQLSMVLFPALRRVSREELVSIYSKISLATGLILPVLYLLYYPLSQFIYYWLPDYKSSLIYLVILFPICVFDGKMNICFSTYFKVLRRENDLLKINSFAFVLSLALACIGCFVVRDIFFVIGGASLSIILRSLIAEILLSKVEGLPLSLLFLGEVAVSLIFILATLKLGGAESFVLTGLGYVAFLLANIKKLTKLINARKE